MEGPITKLEGRLCTVYIFIVTYFAENGYWPCLREIAEGAKLANPSGAAHVVSRLRKLGVLTVKRGGSGATAARRIEVTGLSERLRRVASEWLELFPQGASS